MPLAQESTSSRPPWFATPFDVGVAEPSGDVTFFEAGELTVGAIVGGKPTTMSVRVRPQAVARLDVAPLPGPLVPGGARAASRERVHEDRRAAERRRADLGVRRARRRERGRRRPRHRRRDRPRDDSGHERQRRARPVPVTVVREPRGGPGPRAGVDDRAHRRRRAVPRDRARTPAARAIEMPALRWSVGGGPGGSVESRRRLRRGTARAPTSSRR